MARNRLGDVLLARGKVSAEEIKRALSAQEKRPIRLGELLLEQGVASKGDIAEALEEINRVPYAGTIPAKIPEATLQLIPADVAQRCCAVPLMHDKKKIIIALAEPQNLRHLDELRFVTGLQIETRFGFQDDLEKAVTKFYGKEYEKGGAAKRKAETPAATPMSDGVDEGALAVDQIEFMTLSSTESRREAQKELMAGMKVRTPAVRLVSEILMAAADKNASDVHIEPQSYGVKVRLRIDGILRELSIIPEHQQAAVTSRIKILSDMDISERRLPQDGRFLMKYQKHRMDLRVSTLPTVYGEKVVIRLLQPDAPQVGFPGLGLSKEIEDGLKGILELPQGMLLVVGPTGSGKSTTLYAALSQLRSSTRNIVTVEDPVEYMLEGVNQAQVHVKAGLTFASCLRSILRQDPDIIMVGEIRDQETAEIALKAAQTGHFVLTTLHTNDAVAAVTRLLDLGVPAFLVAASVSGVLAQRLVRRLCVCKRIAPATTEYVARMDDAGIALTSENMYIPGECDLCDGTGYRGRVGIYELLLFDDAVKSLVRKEAPAEEIRTIARGIGFRRMQESALEKTRDGVTSFDEVLRVVPLDRGLMVRCKHCNAELMPNFRFCPYCLEGERGRNRSRALLEEVAV